MSSKPMVFISAILAANDYNVIKTKQGRAAV